MGKKNPIKTQILSRNGINSNNISTVDAKNVLIYQSKKRPQTAGRTPNEMQRNESKL